MQRTYWKGFGDGSVSYDPGMMDALLNAQEADPATPHTSWIAPLALGAIGLGLLLVFIPQGGRR